MNEFDKAFFEWLTGVYSNEALRTMPTEQREQVEAAFYAGADLLWSGSGTFRRRCCDQGN